MPGRRRGARAGRGWDAAPPRPTGARKRRAPADGGGVADGPVIGAAGSAVVDPVGEFAWPDGAEPASPAGAGGRSRRGGETDGAPASRPARSRRQPVDDADADAAVAASWGLPDDAPTGRRERSRAEPAGWRGRSRAGQPDDAGAGSAVAEPAGWRGRSRPRRADAADAGSAPDEPAAPGGWRGRSPGARRAGEPDASSAPDDVPRSADRGRPWSAAIGPTDGVDEPPPAGRGRSAAGRGGRAGRRGGAGRGGERPERPPEPRDEAELAREICLGQLSVRPRTRAELATALTRRGISPETTAEVLDRYDEVGIIDDAAFARAWVASRHYGRGLARRALANELRQRGVDAGVAGEALEELDDSTEAATARALVDRKLRTARGEPEQIFRRLVGMLARKGYPAGLAIRAVKEALAAQSAEAAEFADQVDADALAEAQSNLEAEDHTRPDD
jgi:regulatory protein